MITCYAGEREALRPLFALADDSPANLDQVLQLGHVLVATTPADVGVLLRDRVWSSPAL